MCVCVCACVRACVRVCVCVRACVRACVCGNSGSVSGNVASSCRRSAVAVSATPLWQCAVFVPVLASSCKWHRQCNSVTSFLRRRDLFCFAASVTSKKSQCRHCCKLVTPTKKQRCGGIVSDCMV